MLKHYLFFSQFFHFIFLDTRAGRKQLKASRSWWATSQTGPPAQIIKAIPSALTLWISACYFPPLSSYTEREKKKFKSGITVNIDGNYLWNRLFKQTFCVGANTFLKKTKNVLTIPLSRNYFGGSDCVGVRTIPWLWDPTFKIDKSCIRQLIYKI